jgi:hypothetical protein
MGEGMPEFVDKLSIYSMTCALRDLNAALDKGKTLTFAEVYYHLESGDSVEYLQKQIGVEHSEVRPALEHQNKHFHRGAKVHGQ